MPSYWAFLPFFGYTAHMSLFSRISPVYRDKDYEKFVWILKKASNWDDFFFFFLKLKLLRNKVQKSIENVNNCDFFKEKFEDNHGKDKNYHEVVIIIIQGI